MTTPPDDRAGEREVACGVLGLTVEGSLRDPRVSLVVLGIRAGRALGEADGFEKGRSHGFAEGWYAARDAAYGVCHDVRERAWECLEAIQKLEPQAGDHLGGEAGEP